MRSMRTPGPNLRRMFSIEPPKTREADVDVERPPNEDGDVESDERLGEPPLMLVRLPDTPVDCCE
eukprot:COSAG01_NODE_2542_length_7472_cov_25.428455_9_plen_65_part_00